MADSNLQSGAGAFATAGGVILTVATWSNPYSASISLGYTALSVVGVSSLAADFKYSSGMIEYSMSYEHGHHTYTITRVLDKNGNLIRESLRGSAGCSLSN